MIAEGYRLNLPLRATAPAAAGGVTPGSGSLDAADPVAAPHPVVAVDHDGVVIEAVKAAEDGSGDLVVRLYESFGGRAAPVVSFAAAVEVAAVDLLEGGSATTSHRAGSSASTSVRSDSRCGRSRSSP